MLGDGKKILIFEDNPTIALLLRTFFERRRYAVKLCEDGTEAVKAVREYAPNLIIMDVIMPGKDGIEACTDLRREGVRTPIIILSSKAYEDDKQRGLAAGANAYLLKPFDPKKLEEIIAPLLS